jgi:nitroreductase
MDDLFEIVKYRRSIRRYKPDPISDELLLKIMEAGRWAPSGDNNQPWRFIIVRDSEIMKKMGEIAKEGSGRRFAAEFFTGRMQERFASSKIRKNEKKPSSN